LGLRRPAWHPLVDRRDFRDAAPSAADRGRHARRVRTAELGASLTLAPGAQTARRTPMGGATVTEVRHRLPLSRPERALQSAGTRSTAVPTARCVASGSNVSVGRRRSPKLSVGALRHGSSRRGGRMPRALRGCLRSAVQLRSWFSFCAGPSAQPVRQRDDRPCFDGPHGRESCSRLEDPNRWRKGPGREAKCDAI
jgi:hypothetical protein